MLWWLYRWVVQSHLSKLCVCVCYHHLVKAGDFSYNNNYYYYER